LPPLGKSLSAIVNAAKEPNTNKYYNSWLFKIFMFIACSLYYCISQLKYDYDYDYVDIFKKFIINLL